MNKDEFIKKVMVQLNLEDKNIAERGVQIVLSILSHRLTEEEASDVADQLPHDLKRIWNNDVWITNYFRLSGKRLKYRHRIELLSLIENEILREGLPLHTESLAKAVFHTLKEQITPGESEDISDQLNEEVRDFFKAA
jgi:uncharacterized protein (DUF2267 family)